MDSGKTSIAVSKDTKVMLDDLGNFKESYDNVIKRLVKQNAKCTCFLIEEHKAKEGWE
tara:strand:+ start:1385 stop:1558 length:174 start_codon:yes stop_codon:yes gene_type:complete